MEMNTSQPVPDDEKEDIEVQRQKKTNFILDNLTEEFQLFENDFDFLYNIDSSVIWY